MKQRRELASFTLVELLVVMAVIAILSAITLGASSIIMNWVAKSRANAEIHAMETALESFKTDTGQYPPGTATGYNPAAYIPSAISLYTNLSGKSAYSTAAPSGKVYITFKNSQVGTSGAYSYVQDPFGYAYGYCTNGPMNPAQFDLWSTSGKIDNAQASTNQWITNWQPR